MKRAWYIAGGIVAGVLARQGYKKLNQIKVTGKVVLITGGSRGLGLIMARQLIREGARVIICARDQDTLVNATHELATETNEFLAIQCDIGNKNEVGELFQEIRSKFGEVDIVINNAGIIQVGPIEEMTEQDFQDSLNVHFWGPYYVINEARPSMMRNKWGRIINIISINGKISFPHLLPYTVGKHALAGYSEGLTTELSKYGIKVTSVYPGLMTTGSPRNISVKGKHKKEYAWFKISDSLPGIAMDAENAARKILTAMKQGDKTLVVGLPAKLAVSMEGTFPGLNVSIFGLANKLLPAPTYQKEEQKGYESESEATKSFLAKATDEAAVRNNEI